MKTNDLRCEHVPVFSTYCSLFCKRKSIIRLMSSNVRDKHWKKIDNWRVFQSNQYDELFQNENIVISGILSSQSKSEIIRFGSKRKKINVQRNEKRKRTRNSCKRSDRDLQVKFLLILQLKSPYYHVNNDYSLHKRPFVSLFVRQRTDDNVQLKKKRKKNRRLMSSIYRRTVSNVVDTIEIFISQLIEHIRSLTSNNFNWIFSIK